MKKVVALMLVLVMALSLCACGGSNSGGANNGSAKGEKDIKQILTSGTWKEQGGEGKTYEFNATGSGLASIDSSGGITFKWSIMEDRYVRVEATHVLGIDMTYDYELVEKDGSYRLEPLNSTEYDFVLKK